MIILRNCRLIRELTEGYNESFADILLDGKCIKEIKKVNHNFNIDCEEIDVHNNTVIPGLIELHAHLNLLTQNCLDMINQDPVEAAFDGYKCAREYIKQGYTTVRDCGSSYGVVNGVRDAINKDIVEGPRVISCGQIITPTEIGNNNFPLMYIEADGVDEVRKTCRQLFQKGADFIKYTATGSFYNEGGVPGQTIVTMEELQTAVGIAESKNSYVSAHCHGTEAIKLAIKAGIRTIEHASFIDDEGLEMIKDSKTCYLVPTIAVDKIPYDYPELIPKHMWDKVNTLTEASHTCIKKAYNAGLKLGWGSDLDTENLVKKPGYEFIARKEMLGFKNIDMLMQATKYSSEICGLDNKIGTIKEGKYADLIVVNGNPDEDIYAMAKKILYVIKEGKLFKF